jgi:hypothetical protein
MAKTSLVLIVASLIAGLLSAGDWPAVATSDSAIRLETNATDAAILLPEGHHEVETASPVMFGDVYSGETETGFVLRAGKQWQVSSAPPRVAPNAGSAYYGGRIASGRTFLRVERDTYISDAVLLTFQRSLDQNILVDLPADGGIPNGPSDWPQMQGRVAFTLGFAWRTTDQLNWTVRATSAFDFLEGSPPPFDAPPESDACFETSSLNVDLRVPFGERAGFGARYYTGVDINSLLDAMGRDVWFRLPSPVRSTGGWCEVWYDWTPRCHSRVGVGIDDSPNHDSFLRSTHNHLIFANLSIDLTDRLATGVEITWRETSNYDGKVNQLSTDRRVELGPTVAIDWVVQCSF